MKLISVESIVKQLGIDEERLTLWMSEHQPEETVMDQCSTACSSKDIQVAGSPVQK